MAYDSEFASILRACLGSPAETPGRKEPIAPAKTWTKATQPVFIHLENRPKMRVPKRAYDREKGKKHRLRRASPPPAPPQKPKEPELSVADLTPNTRQLLNQLSALGAVLPPTTIKLSHIKKAYRQLAKTFHPDHQGPKACPDKFQQATRVYRSLNQALRAHFESSAQK
jgi:hypothetical protein